MSEKPLLAVRVRRWQALLCALCLASGCGMPVAREAPAPAAGAGPGGREQPLALSPHQEWAVGRRAYDEIMNEFRGRVLPEDSPEVERVRRITARLVRAAAIEPLQREIKLRVHGYRFEWKANVVRDRQVNAFCLPAGWIFVYTGLLAAAGRDDAQLAAVLSHEIAHALAHHASERVARQQSGAGILRSLSYNRMQESEADKIGVFLMAFADYDPNQAAVFWERMRAARGGGSPLDAFLSDHPGHEERARNLRRDAPAARAAKRAFDEGRIAPPNR